MSTDRSILAKLAALMAGQLVICSSVELDAIAPLDAANLIRSKPIGKELESNDQCWECWIEHQDLAKIPASV